jgi:hypothetical protein
MNKLSIRTGGIIPALFLAVMLIGFTGISQKAQAQDYYSNGGYDDSYGNYGDYQQFYDDLSPYGQWISDPQYGYVWTPNVGRDFRPYYTNGNWAMTQYGNTWVSNYAWGWAPFHYGRWAQSNYYGWIWIPGNTWGPAWVNWRQGGGYYGWSPMGPGVSINISFGSGYSVPNAWWTFVPYANIYARNYSPYYRPNQNTVIYNNTTIINNTYVDASGRNRTTYVTGPRRSEVEAAGRQNVNVYNLNSRNSSGTTRISGSNLDIYRPAVTTSNRAVNSAPRNAKVVENSIITNNGGGRTPSRVANLTNSNVRNNASNNSSAGTTNRMANGNRNRGNVNTSTDMSQQRQVQQAQIQQRQVQQEAQQRQVQQAQVQQRQAQQEAQQRQIQQQAQQQRQTQQTQQRQMQEQSAQMQQRSMQSQPSRISGGGGMERGADRSSSGRR